MSLVISKIKHLAESDQNSLTVKLFLCKIIQFIGKISLHFKNLFLPIHPIKAVVLIVWNSITSLK